MNLGPAELLIILACLIVTPTLVTIAVIIGVARRR